MTETVEPGSLGKASGKGIRHARVGIQQTPIAVAVDLLVGTGAAGSQNRGVAGAEVPLTIRLFRMLRNSD